MIFTFLCFILRAAVRTKNGTFFGKGLCVPLQRWYNASMIFESAKTKVQSILAIVQATIEKTERKFLL